MDQTQARKIAKERGGVAISARPRKNGGWMLGGWMTKESIWVVELPTGEVISEESE